MRVSIPFLAGAALMLSACGGNDVTEDTAAADATPAAGEAAASSATVLAASADGAAAGGQPAVFAQCKVCHSTEKGKNMVGPSLAGIYGTKAGEVPGFAFSKAMLESGKVWDDATLDAYLAAPMKDVPGTKMAFGGVSDPAKRKELIAYLKTLK